MSIWVSKLAHFCCKIFSSVSMTHSLIGSQFPIAHSSQQRPFMPVLYCAVVPVERCKKLKKHGCYGLHLIVTHPAAVPKPVNSFPVHRATFGLSVFGRCCFGGSSIHQPIFWCLSHYPDPCPHRVLHILLPRSLWPSYLSLVFDFSF